MATSHMNRHDFGLFRRAAMNSAGLWRARRLHHFLQSNGTVCAARPNAVVATAAANSRASRSRHLVYLRCVTQTVQRIMFGPVANHLAARPLRPFGRKAAANPLCRGR
jgi:hypothetical protein